MKIYLLSFLWPRGHGALLIRCFLPAMIWWGPSTAVTAAVLELTGLNVTPHLQMDSMRYARKPEPAEGARVQLFLRHSESSVSPLVINADSPLRFNGQSPGELLKRRIWAWHDTPPALPGTTRELPPGTLTVWAFNGRKLPWGAGGRITLEFGPPQNRWLVRELTLAAPKVWISAVTFLAPVTALQPESMIVHLANESDEALTIRKCRFWLPRDSRSPGALFAQATLTNLHCFAGKAVLPPRDKTGFTVKTPPLPLTYCALEIELAGPEGESIPLWTHLRIKPERFDISGGWVNDPGHAITSEAFLKTLKRIHVNTAHYISAPGYLDTELFARYPLKLMGRLRPFEQFDTDAMLPRIHADESLGEPQYGGGRPVPPQEVWEKLQPYTVTRLPTSITHSEERIWRDYAGLSDFPHYDAYRVSAPSADAWRKYDRWGGRRINWGAPLETIGDMSRSLRELNRPMPTAYWSQGPHYDWDVYGGRKRTTPTPEEIRSQAYHAISTRITSFYWFNLSLRSIVKWRDTLSELGRIGRELRIVEDLLLEGDAYRHERLRHQDGKLDWDLSSVCGPRAALLFSLDLDYVPDPERKVFVFRPPREATWRFPLPTYLSGVTDVFRLDAEGIHDVRWTRAGRGVAITDRLNLVGVYVATSDTQLRTRLEARRQRLIQEEESLNFDPARRDEDFEQLAALLNSR